MSYDAASLVLMQDCFRAETYSPEKFTAALFTASCVLFALLARPLMALEMSAVATLAASMFVTSVRIALPRAFAALAHVARGDGELGLLGVEESASAPLVLPTQCARVWKLSVAGPSPMS